MVNQKFNALLTLQRVGAERLNVRMAEIREDTDRKILEIFKQVETK